MAIGLSVLGFFAFSLRSAPMLGCCCIRWDWEVPGYVAIFFGFTAVLLAGFATARECTLFLRWCWARGVWRRACAGRCGPVPGPSGATQRDLAAEVVRLRAELERELWLSPELAQAVLAFARRAEMVDAGLGLHSLCCAALVDTKRPLRQAMALDAVLERFGRDLRSGVPLRY